MSKLRILVVDDSVVVRRLMTNVLSSDPGVEVAGTAATGRIALARMPLLNPDLIVLDIEMPNGDGRETLVVLRKNYPRLPVIIFSVLSNQTADEITAMLALGACDYVRRAVNVHDSDAATQLIRNELLPKIKRYCFSQGTAGLKPASASPRILLDSAPAQRARRARKSRIDVLVIGASTGGPNALAELMGSLPSDFPVPVLIVQHLPVEFTALLSDRLDRTSHMPVSLGTPHAAVGPAHAWMAPGDFHMALVTKNDVVHIQTHQGPPENSCRPSADVLFRSAAEVYGPHTLAVVLTGMGQDGLRGCERIHEAAGQIFVQDEASSVVWGMPGFVARAGLADKVLPLGQLGSEIVRAVWEFRSPRLDLKPVKTRTEKDGHNAGQQ